MTLEAETRSDAEIGRGPTWCRRVPERVPRPAGCISWISPPFGAVPSTHHMLRGGLCLSTTPFLPQPHPSLARDIPIQSRRVGWCPPWGAQRSFLPSAPRGWTCRANPLLAQLRWCPPSEQAPPKARHGARGSVCLLNQLLCASPTALSTSIIGLTVFADSTKGVGSGVFLTEPLLRPDRHTAFSLPLSGVVFCLFTRRKHRYRTFLSQQGNLHSRTGRSTESAETFP